VGVFHAQSSARTLFLVSIATGVLALAGCGRDGEGPASDTPAASTAPPSTTAASSSAPPLTDTTRFTVEGRFATADGYGYRLQLELTQLAPEKNVANERPGFAAITRAYDSTSYWNLTNLQTDRNAPLATGTVQQLALYGLFKSSRPVCKVIRPRYEITLNGSDKTCSVRLGYLVRPQDASQAIEPDGTAAGTFAPDDTGFTPLWNLRELPERQVDAVMRDVVRGPDVTAVLIEDAYTVNGWRTPFGAFSDTACLVEANGVGGQGLILFMFTGTAGQGQSMSRC
jgi:hypothetical protein